MTKTDRAGGFPNAGLQTWLLGWGPPLPPSPAVAEPVSRTCRRESPVWGEPGFLIPSAPRWCKHQARGHMACSVHVRQAPRAAPAAHSSAQVGTTRCPWRAERIHTTWSSSRGTGHGPGRDTAPPAHSHTPGATGHGARPARLRVGQADPQRPVQRGGRHGLGGDGERALSRQASVGPENLLKTANAHTLYLGECHGVGISPK